MGRPTSMGRRRVDVVVCLASLQILFDGFVFFAQVYEATVVYLLRMELTWISLQLLIISSHVWGQENDDGANVKKESSGESDIELKRCILFINV